jgi:hypothetical protein
VDHLSRAKFGRDRWRTSKERGLGCFRRQRVRRTRMVAGMSIAGGYIAARTRYGPLTGGACFAVLALSGMGTI